MALAARCPECNTAFRIVPDQLKISEGWVRCGHCSYVFNAFESQFEISEAALQQTLHEQQSILKSSSTSFAQSQSFSEIDNQTENSSIDEQNAQTIDLADDAYENTAFEDTILEDYDNDSDGLELSEADSDSSFLQDKHEQTDFNIADTLLSEFHIGWQDSFNQTSQNSKKSDIKTDSSQPVSSQFNDSSLDAETLPPEHPAWDIDLDYEKLFESSWQDGDDIQTLGMHNEIPHDVRFSMPDEEVALDDPETLPPVLQESHQSKSPHAVETQRDQDDDLEVNTSSGFASTSFFQSNQDNSTKTSDTTHLDRGHEHAELAPFDSSLNSPSSSHHANELANSSLPKNNLTEIKEENENTIESRFGNTAFALSVLELSDEMEHIKQTRPAIIKDTPKPLMDEHNSFEASHLTLSSQIDDSLLDSESTILSNPSSKYKNTDKKHKKKRRSSNRTTSTRTYKGESVATKQKNNENIRELSFAKEKSFLAFWNHPAVKFGQYLTFFILSVIFLTQLALIYKDALAAQFPALRPALSRLCEPFACSVQYTKKISDITIYDSSFRRTNALEPDRYTLMLLLKNTGKQILEFPWVELTLIDNATGAPYSRKIFSPQDLGIQTTYFLPGQEAQINRQFTIHTDENTSLGFKISLFYP